MDRRKIISIISSVVLIGAVLFAAKYIFIDLPKKDEETSNSAAVYQQAYKLASEAIQLKHAGKIERAAKKYYEAARTIQKALDLIRINDDPHTSGLRKKMLDCYEECIALYTQVALRDPVDKRAQVTYIFDGDTVELEDRERIRYLGIDAPEKDTPWGPKATRANSLMVDKKTVQLKYDEEKIDIYQRTLAYVFAGSLFVNVELVKQGQAKYYCPVGSPLKYRTLFLASEALAKEKKLGLWAETH